MTVPTKSQQTLVDGEAAPKAKTRYLPSAPVSMESLHPFARDGSSGRYIDESGLWEIDETLDAGRSTIA
jgi:hypothetical protein